MSNLKYINVSKKRLVGRSNQTVPPLCIDYSTLFDISFQFIDERNQVVQLDSSLSGFAFAGSLKMGDMSTNLLWLCQDFSIENDTLTFHDVNTFTVPFMAQIKKKNTEVNIEISQMSLNSKTVWLRDYALCEPRVWVAGLSPAEVDSQAYFTKTETQELLAQNLAESKNYTDEAIEHISGYVTEEEFTEAKAELEGDIALKAAEADLQIVSGEVQNVENNTQIISGDLDSLELVVSSKAEQSVVDAIQSDLDELSGTVSGKANTAYVDSELALKQDAITAENKLDYALLSGTPAIPTKTSDLTNDSGYQTASEVEAAVSGKQAAITADNKLDYALLSGTPAIPTKTSDLANDSGYQTASEVEAAISGKQDKITADNKLGYDLLSGTPDLSVYAKEADLQIVSGALDDKLDAPSGGTSGQILTKTADGAEWAALQIADYTVPDYFTVTALANNCIVKINESLAGAAALKAVIEYSTDGGKTWFNYAWTSGQGTAITLANAGDSVMFRGDNATFSTSFFNQQYRFNVSENYKISGNLISLIDKKVKKKQAPAGCYWYIFKDQPKLIDASEVTLPEAAVGTYFGTFQNCSNLSEAPKIPKDWIRNGASHYNYMFKGCSNLSSINVEFIDWIGTTDWLDGVAASGSFYCSYGLDTSTRDASHIPVGWDVIYKNVPESVVSQAAAVENLIMNND